MCQMSEWEWFQEKQEQPTPILHVFMLHDVLLYAVYAKKKKNAALELCFK